VAEAETRAGADWLLNNEISGRRKEKSPAIFVSGSFAKFRKTTRPPTKFSDFPENSFANSDIIYMGRANA
jgi:hypothetical protein